MQRRRLVSKALLHVRPITTLSLGIRTLTIKQKPKPRESLPRPTALGVGSRTINHDVHVPWVNFLLARFILLETNLDAEVCHTSPPRFNADRMVQRTSHAWSC